MQTTPDQIEPDTLDPLLNLLLACDFSFAHFIKESRLPARGVAAFFSNDIVKNVIRQITDAAEKLSKLHDSVTCPVAINTMKDLAQSAKSESQRRLAASAILRHCEPKVATPRAPQPTIRTPAHPLLPTTLPGPLPHQSDSINLSPAHLHLKTPPVNDLPENTQNLTPDVAVASHHHWQSTPDPLPPSIAPQLAHSGDCVPHTAASPPHAPVTRHRPPSNPTIPSPVT